LSESVQRQQIARNLVEQFEVKLNLVQSIDPLYAFSGLCVGALVGMTGVGGGSLMTPLLILLCGIHPAAAVGTDLLYAAITKTFGTAVHGYTHTVDWRAVSPPAAYRRRR
jgi:uncharacterized membrane protein YfcA